MVMIIFGVQKSDHVECELRLKQFDRVHNIDCQSFVEIPQGLQRTGARNAPINPPLECVNCVRIEFRPDFSNPLDIVRTVVLLFARDDPT